LLVDTLWVLVFPKAVPSNPSSIIIHHFATILYCVIPFVDSQFSWHMAICLVVELNSLMLAIRRNLVKGTMLYRFCELSFFASWIALRLILYPILVIFMWFEYCRYREITGTWVNMMAAAPVFQFILTAMSIKWTYDLAGKIFFKNKA